MDSLWMFALLVFGIIVLPGMDMAFVLSSALVNGRRAGFAAVAGLVLAGMVHVAMGMVGVGFVLQHAPRAFNALLLAGAAYIAWVALSIWRQPGTLGEVDIGHARTTGQTFIRAVMTCLLNPKAYVFMVAVFPQFIRPEGSLLRQGVALGLIVAATQFMVYGAVAAGAAGLRGWLRSGARNQIVLARSVAGLLALAAVWTLWQSWRAG